MSNAYAGRMAKMVKPRSGANRLGIRHKILRQQLHRHIAIEPCVTRIKISEEARTRLA